MNYAFFELGGVPISKKWDAVYAMLRPTGDIILRNQSTLSNFSCIFL